MWKTLLIIVLLIFFISSMLGKMIRFLRTFEQKSSPNYKPEKEGSMKIFVPKEQVRKKTFKGGEYTDYEEVQ